MKDRVRIGVREPITDVTAGVIDYRYLVFQILQIIRTAGMEVVQHSDIMFLDQNGCQIGPDKPCTTRYQYVHTYFSVMLTFKRVVAYRKWSVNATSIPPIAPLTTTSLLTSLCTLLIANNPTERSERRMQG